MWFYLFFLLGVAVLYVLFKILSKGPPPDKTGGPAPISAAKPISAAPGNNTPIFAGVRVLEMCEVVATPIAGRYLADCGADVIKVERKGKGDLARHLIAAQFEKDRPFASAFEMVNTSKRSITLDTKDPIDREKLLQLIADCDIFLTNTRYHALKKLGLTYEDLHDKFPHVIYAHLSAFGTTGPCAKDPGFDTTAFWVNTGLSGIVHRPGLFNMYPVGFGDVISGSTIFSGLCMALKIKQQCGLGINVNTSLFNLGVTTLAATACAVPGPEQERPEYGAQSFAKSPLCAAAYECKNTKYVLIGVEHDQAPAALESLKKTIPEITNEDNVYSALKKKFIDMEVNDVIKLLRGANVDCKEFVIPPSGEENLKRDDPRWEYGSFEKSHCEDLDRLYRHPFTLGCSTQHEARCRAPYLGQHNDDVAKNGWYKDRHEKSILPSTSTGKCPTDAPLAGLTVVEWGTSILTAATFGMFAADFGAKVIKIEPKEGDYFRKKDPHIFEAFNRGKSSIVTDNVLAQVEKADVFVTNQPLSKLKEYGVDPDTLREKFPKLIIAVSSPRGMENDERQRSDYLSWYGECGLSLWFEPVPTGYPAHMGAIHTGIHLWAGVTAALFHRDRTGEGQIVEVSLFRSGTMAPFYINTFLLRQPEFSAMIGRSPQEVDIMRYYTVLISFSCYKTKDGVWIQIIGPDLAKDGVRLIKALGLWGTIACGLPGAVAGFISEKRHLFYKLRHVGKVLVKTVEESIAKFTLAECEKKFKEKGVWWCKVVMPSQTVHHPQAKALGLLAKENIHGGRLVCQPLNIISREGQNYADVASRAPNLGESM